MTTIFQIGRPGGVYILQNFSYRVKFLNPKILEKTFFLCEKYFFAYLKTKIFNIWPLVGTSATEKTGLWGTGRAKNFFGGPPLGVLEAT